MNEFFACDQLSTASSRDSNSSPCCTRYAKHHRASTIKIEEYQERIDKLEFENKYLRGKVISLERTKDELQKALIASLFQPEVSRNRNQVARAKEFELGEVNDTIDDSVCEFIAHDSVYIDEKETSIADTKPIDIPILNNIRFQMGRHEIAQNAQLNDSYLETQDDSVQVYTLSLPQFESIQQLDRSAQQFNLFSDDKYYIDLLEQKDAEIARHKRFIEILRDKLTVLLKRPLKSRYILGTQGK